MAVTEDVFKERPLRRLRSDLRKGAVTLTAGEVRWLVDSYYSYQDYRIQASGQLRAATKSEEQPHEALANLAEQMSEHEKEIQSVLDAWTRSEPSGIGVWLLSIYGIGPVIAAGLMAHTNIEMCPTVGHLWAFAGLDPTRKWDKGQKRPWNAKLKVICWKAGQSFMMFHKQDNCYYGHIYAERKALEQERNERGDFTEQAANILASKNFGKDTDARAAYSQGKLPPAHIDARARRYAVKLFLAAFFEESYRSHYKKEPPLPYPLAHLGHVHRIDFSKSVNG
jgi:hypothetical protein